MVLESSHTDGVVKMKNTVEKLALIEFVYSLELCRNAEFFILL